MDQSLMVCYAICIISDFALTLGIGTQVWTWLQQCILHQLFLVLVLIFELRYISPPTSPQSEWAAADSALKQYRMLHFNYAHHFHHYSEQQNCSHVWKFWIVDIIEDKVKFVKPYKYSSI